MTVSVPRFQPGDEIGCLATADIVGATYVKIAAASGGNEIQVVTAGAGDRPFGVAAFDVLAGQMVTVLRGRFVNHVTAGATITNKQEISVGALGKAVPTVTTDLVVGQATDDAISGALAEIASL